MKKKNTAPDRRVALAYVTIQAIILILLLFTNFSFGYRLQTFGAIGSSLQWLGIIGIIASAYSIRTSLTAMPLPKEHGQLATNGLYAYMRHPMYTSVLLLSLGIALSSGEVYKFLLVIGLYVLFYYKSVYEEVYLAAKYTGYKHYASKTPRFFPFTK